MPQFLSQAGHASVILVEVIALVWVGRRALDVVNRVRFRGQLMDKDNPAAGVLVAGFQIGLFLALSGLLAGEQSTLAHDSMLTAAHGAGAVAALILCPFVWRPLVHVQVHADILEKKNLGSGLVVASLLASTGLIYRGAVSGQGEHAGTTAAFFAVGEGALLLSTLLYEWVTPYDVYAEIGEKSNLAAALSFSGACLAAGLILGNAVEGEFKGWRESILESLLYMTPLLALPVVRWILVNGLLLGMGSVNREVRDDRSITAGLVEGSAYLGLAFFVIHLTG
jgi:uncharacterized membrane protein YjfL (UPF0719 family)